MYEPSTKRAALLMRDYKKVPEISAVYVKVNRALNEMFEAAATQWNERINDITSEKNWRNYLKIST